MADMASSEGKLELQALRGTALRSNNSDFGQRMYEPTLAAAATPTVLQLTHDLAAVPS